MSVKRCWVFANGELNAPDRLKALIRPGDRLIAADGGYGMMKALGLTPHLLIGDLDSISPADLEQLIARGVPVERFPVEKDETDLELAIMAAVQGGAQEVTVAGALGGRLDQALGNLFLLAHPALAGLDVWLEDGETEVFLISKAAQINGQPGDTVSLLPLGLPARGVRTEGLRYPLNGETLFPERTRGISNVLLNYRAMVTLDEGLLICVHIRPLKEGKK